ncbi:tripartite tricarboxylate transporter substrate binding protein [Roseomonas frigidaquae]|uniref:Tripartite tricarboxylate transporter substrate binding protein n=1 Tax=Falsiroseomonas frigidaquae TaxID=487318 RepID=A0ABX1EVB0_9PROT|nr:tripartite tricarboxylate transporter substrate binding protein [Falsiroseomonas frigidaquae]NKE44067.1 tripartite tricarboxylate transporter substrate binding protein [Falsiroseomonas frigidaquae]
MNITRRQAGAGLLGALALPGFARAQSFPSRTIRLVVGFAAGGPTDVIARVVAQDMSASLGQSVIVENRTGANALVATEAVAREQADGYTLMVTTLSHSVNSILLPNARYHPLRDFAPVSLLAVLPLIAVTGATTPYRTLAQLVDAAKAKPGEVTYGSAGNGGSAHLAAALLAVQSGTEMTHVPFRGNAPALTEVMSGRVSFMFYPMIGLADHIARGSLRPLGVSTAERSPDYPQVPTMREIGYPGFEDYSQGLGIAAPAGTPEPVVARLNAAVRASLEKPETNQRLKSLGAIVTASTPAEFGAFLERDLDRWRRVIEAAKITG